MIPRHPGSETLVTTRPTSAGLDVEFDFDFAVAGGGPAGTSAAISLAQRGHRVVLFERERFPRFHIGESLLSTANEHFEALGVTEPMRAARFPDKWGARLFTHDGHSGRGVDFAVVQEVAVPQTMQVCRQEFDRILLERARELGVEVRELHRVTGCEFAPDGVTVDFVGGGADAGRVRVRAIVDATGRTGLLGKRFALRTDEPRLANVAVFAHYSGVPRLAGDRPDDIRLIARDDAGWFWVIPVGPDLTSVGVVLPKALYLQRNQGDPEALLAAAIADTAVVADLMKGAKREWPVRVEKEFSYSASRYAGDRWILAGDAGSFLDPVFSTGVSIAMETGIEAAAELDRALRAGDFSARRFAAFERRCRERYASFRRFVLGFYTPEFRDLFFSEDPPPRIFRAVVTVLSGRWRPSWTNRLLVRLFFLFVAIQRWNPISQRHHRRGVEAGYPA
jgi:flavin-dependent dehydrogenase